MRSPTLTRRGRIVVVVCVLATALALAGGGGAINAVILSGLVALAAGYLQVARVDRPEAVRSRPADGFVGERRTVSLTFEGAHGTAFGQSPFLARVTDVVDDGLTILGREPSLTTIGGGPVSYTVEYVSRGRRRFGPVRIEATDVFGLFVRELVVDERTTAIAYPERHPISPRFRRGLYAEEGIGRSPQREAFDRLREYARGDSLRDVHWPATAKHDELVVKAFSAERERRRVTIVGRTVDTGNGPGGEGIAAADEAAADLLASAAVSLSLAFLSDGVSVDLRLPDGSAVAHPDSTGRRELLELAALTGPGAPSDGAKADVRLVADDTDVRLHANGRPTSFTALRSEATDGSGARDDPTTPTRNRTDRPRAPLADGGERR
ncbi:DUF58 domain-containing protein [Halorubrum vacuolatum]|uniref:Uncharacterized conserved protein, DUF58 family, contains vWF domain n=1 Tax=Halorubrum vacuolatum TaxID=63740 RepID=A0A238USE8_HALVU|nr:DUF58 domain-containing protein [Halorubrum vacuolatum]SNR24851.1 Uncharacterized conserved protein, DUF58 family, contains vWF domain [Halorubrum vacuolatum]